MKRLLSIGLILFWSLVAGKDTRYISNGHATIAIVGAGAVGTTIAYAIMLRDIASEVIMVDLDEQRCCGEVLDLSDALPTSSTAHVRQGTYKDASRSDVIIITAGVRRKLDQSRLDLIKVNKSILMTIVSNMGIINPTAVVIVVSNPVDIMTYYMQQISGLPEAQVFGSGTYLDTLRLRVALANELGVAEQSIQAYILGEHGDSQVAVWSSANVAGIPLQSFAGISREVFDQCAIRARQKGQKIIALKNATFYGIGVCVADMCESIIFNQRRVFPVSTMSHEFDVCMSMPAILGENGVESVLSVPLDAKEKEELSRSMQILKDNIAQGI